jgi:hypothetical protein
MPPKKNAENKGGRPAKFTQALADAVCERLANGKSLRAICRDEAMPSLTTVMMWARTDEKFTQQYTRAREQQADVLADEIVDIADEDPQTILTRSEDGESDARELRIDGAAVQFQRLRIDARKWFASKVAPKKYGDKLELAGDKERPLTVLNVQMPPEEAARAYKEMMSGRT